MRSYSRHERAIGDCGIEGWGLLYEVGLANCGEAPAADAARHTLLRDGGSVNARGCSAVVLWRAA